MYEYNTGLCTAADACVSVLCSHLLQLLVRDSVHMRKWLAVQHSSVPAGLLGQPSAGCQVC